MGSCSNRPLGHRHPFPIFQEKVNDEVTVNAVRRKADEDAEITDRPNDIAEASLHKASRECRGIKDGKGDMMPFPGRPSNQKWRFSLCKSAKVRNENSCKQGPTRRCDELHKMISLPKTWLSIFCALTLLLPTMLPAQEEPVTEEKYEREELGVNPYTTPSIEDIFKQLDELRPLPFDQLKRDFPAVATASREHKGLIFGGLIADGFLIVDAERKNLVDELGRILLREAKGLGVGDRVMRHSASLTELGKRGEWPKVRKELISTQADVEKAMVDLRDQKMAHLISLGGWLRGLEICAGAVEANFSTARAKVLVQPELADYFAEELKTLPPALARTGLMEKIRTALEKIRVISDKAKQHDLTVAMYAQFTNRLERLTRPYPGPNSRSAAVSCRGREANGY